MVLMNLLETKMSSLSWFAWWKPHHGPKCAYPVVPSKSFGMNFDLHLISSCRTWIFETSRRQPRIKYILTSNFISYRTRTKLKSSLRMCWTKPKVSFCGSTSLSRILSTDYVTETLCGSFGRGWKIHRTQSKVSMNICLVEWINFICQTLSDIFPSWWRMKMSVGRPSH